MKKIFIIIILFFLTLITFLNFATLGTKKVKLENSKINITIPNLSFLYKSEKNKIIFKSLRGERSLKRELEKIQSRYIPKKCNHNLIYYDKDNNVTIRNYKIYKNGLNYSLSVTFQVGEISNNKCEKINNIKYTDIKSIECNNGCYQNNKYKLRDKENNIFFLYYDLEKDLLIKTGMDNYNYLSSALEYKWLYREDLIKFMDYLVSVDKNAIKNTSRGYDIYYTKEFALINCKNENKNIYISTPSAINKTFCN